MTAPRSRRWRRLGLTSDARLDLFAVLFALGTIDHELEFALEQA